MEQIAVYKRYSETPPDSMIFMVIDYLIHRKVEYIVAPYEADSQLAYLYHQKKIDFIVSEDSDMIAYDCFRLIKKFRANGECLIMNITNKRHAAKGSNLEKFMELSRIKREKRSSKNLHNERLRLFGQLQRHWIYHSFEHISKRKSERRIEASYG